MKCENCGYQNNDEVVYCYQCGEKLKDNASSNPGSTYNNNHPYDFNPNCNNNASNSYIPNEGQHNQVEHPCNTNQMANLEGKHMVISLSLSIIPPLFISGLTGIGLLYLGLKRRFYYVLAIGILLMLVNVLVVLVRLTLVQSIMSIVIILWWILTVYDTYICNKAINNNGSIPSFIGLVNLY